MIATSGAEPRRPWIRVLRENWATSVVTICTALIRSTIVFQAGLVTSMLAGIILETIGVPVFQAPLYSIIRALDVAPYSLLSTTKLRSKGVLSIFIYTLLAIEVLVTLASQFLSTILISDFTDSSFADMNNSTTVRTMEDSDLATGTKWWMVPPASGWTFAELSEASEEGQDFDDTGHTYRAFLPFEDEAKRTDLRKFHGETFVMDQRVVCARPSLTDLTLDVTYGDSVRLSGQITVDASSYPMLQETEDQRRVNFTCGLPHASRETDTKEAGSSICSPKSGTEWWLLLKDPLVDPSSYEGLGGSTDTGPPIAGIPKASTMLMVLNVVSIEAIIEDITGAEKVEVVRNDGPWAMIPNASGDEALRVTACITNLGAQTFTLDMDGPHARQEPKLTWDRRASNYGTEAGLRQLGVTSTAKTLQERGVLSLGRKSEWQPSLIDPSARIMWFFSLSLSNSMSTPDANSRPNIGVPDTDVILSGSSVIGNFAHESHSALFHGALRSTESPALATQAMLARLHQMAYYDALPKPNATAEASTSFSTSALIPVRWSGFIAATAIITTHFIIVAIVAILFLWLTSHSFIGHHWQAVSQVLSEDTLPILEQADEMKDKDVKIWAKSKSIDLGSPALLRCRDNGRVALSTQGLSLPRPLTSWSTVRSSTSVDTGESAVRVDGTAGTESRLSGENNRHEGSAQ